VFTYINTKRLPRIFQKMSRDRDFPLNTLTMRSLANRAGAAGLFESQDAAGGLVARLFWSRIDAGSGQNGASGPLKNATPGSSRGNEAQISSETEAI